MNLHDESAAGCAQVGSAHLLLQLLSRAALSLGRERTLPASNLLSQVYPRPLQRSVTQRSDTGILPTADLLQTSFRRLLRDPRSSSGSGHCTLW